MQGESHRTCLFFFFSDPLRSTSPHLGPHQDQNRDPMEAALNAGLQNITARAAWEIVMWGTEYDSFAVYQTTDEMRIS